MKKIYSLLLVFVIMLGVCSCNKNQNFSKMSLDTMLSQAEEIDTEKLITDMKSNIIRAKELYDGKIVKLSNVEVVDFAFHKADGSMVDFGVEGKKNNLTSIIILSKEEAKLINKGDTISIVGVLRINNYANSNASNKVDIEDAQLYTPELTVDYAIEHLLDYDDLTSLEFLLDTKEDYKKLTGEEIKHSLAFEWIEMKRIYKKADDALEKFATYTGNIILERDGIGETKSPGNEPLSWLVDGDYLFFKSITDGKEVVPVTPEETKYKYEVREIRTDENIIDTVYACYSVAEGTYNTLFLLVHPQSKFAKYNNA